MNTARKQGKLTLGPLVLSVVFLCAAPAMAQKKFSRSRPPSFKPSDYEGVFFDDVGSMLRGQLPSRQATLGSSAVANNSSDKPAVAADANDPLAWPKLIEPASLEDLIKGSKLRLDKVVTTPPAFIGGGYAVARREFSLLAILFSIIEEYPGEIRWQESAASARELLTQAAASAKIGTLPVFNQAKNRLLDLGDLTRGTKLAHEAKTELVWEDLADRSLLMQLLEWAHEEQLSDLVVDKETFSSNTDAIKRYAELVAALGKVNLIEGMPDADDDDYRELGLAMIKAAGDITVAVKTNDADAARKAAGQIGQSCSNCHDGYR
ncbi:MAG: hypothetical protein Aurels2KO_01320 [Aureliella sp.]